MPAMHPRVPEPLVLLGAVMLRLGEVWPSTYSVLVPSTACPKVPVAPHAAEPATVEVPFQV